LVSGLRGFKLGALSTIANLLGTIAREKQVFQRCLRVV
jgi:hypothetical protein